MEINPSWQRNILKRIPLPLHPPWALEPSCDDVYYLWEQNKKEVKRIVTIKNSLFDQIINNVFLSLEHNINVVLRFKNLQDNR